MRAAGARTGRQIESKGTTGFGRSCEINSDTSIPSLPVKGGCVHGNVGPHTAREISCWDTAFDVSTAQGHKRGF